MTIDNRDEPDFRNPLLNTQQTVKEGFQDTTGSYPRSDYYFEPGTNQAARGRRRNELSLGGGMDGVSFDLPPQAASQYPYNDVKETTSGHIIEIDDTPGGERVLIMHRSGAGVELRADGSVVIKAENNIVTSVAGSSALIVEGDVDMKVNGNMNLTVAGDLNINVAGNLNTSVGGNMKETVNGSSREMVYGPRGSVVKGSRSETTIGARTDTTLGGLNQIVKGDMRQSVDGNLTSGVSGTAKATAVSEMIISSANINMGASNLSVFGASGTIGGAGIVHYGESFYGDTFHGDLDGTARLAVRADVTNSQNYPSNQTGNDEGYTINNNGAASAAANGSMMDSYLNQSAYGTIKVSVDPGDFLKNIVDKTVDNGGISERDLSTREVRSKLRDPAAMSNSTFLGNAVATGRISQDYVRTVPSGVNRIANSSGEIRTARVSMGDRLAVIDRYRSNKNTTVTRFTPNPNFDPNKLPETTPIDATVKLGQSVTLAKFLGGTGERVTLSHIPTREEKLAIARQFAMHVPAMDSVLKDQGAFRDYRLVVAEGLYVKGQNETLTPSSLNDLATKGRVVVYELHNRTGKPDLEKTYDLALWWKDTLLYDKLIISYDNFDPSGALTAQIILVMPEVDANYNIVGTYYKNELQTLYNNNVQSNELIEITAG